VFFGGQTGPESKMSYNCVNKLVTKIAKIRCDGLLFAHSATAIIKKPSPYSIMERRVPELIPVLGSRPAGDVSHKPGGRLPLLFARSAVTPATLKRAATSFAAL